MESPDKSTPSNTSGKDASEKVIHIDVCRNCKNHRSSTWHDEAKYENNFNLVKAEIETLIPGVQVLKKEVEVTNLGAFEIMHGEKVIYSKKTSGLWPNAKAVAQRVDNYFKDLEAGRDISAYGTQKEKAFISPKKSSDRKSYTSGFSDFQALSSKSNKKGDSAGGSPEKEGTPDEQKKQEENENGIENRDDQHGKEEHDQHHNNLAEHDHQHGKEEEKTEHKEHEEHAENLSPVLHGSATHILGGIQEGEHKEQPSPVKHHEEGEPQKDISHETPPEAEKHGEHETHEKTKEHEEPGSASGHEVKIPAEHGEHAEQENKAAEGNSPLKAEKNPTEDEYKEDFAS